MISLNPFTYIKDTEQAIAAARQLMKEPVVGFDTETTSLDPLETGAALRLCQFATPSHTYIFDVPYIGEMGRMAIRRVLETEKVIKVGHNIKFDQKFTKIFLGLEWFGTCYDTMLAAQLLSYGNANEGFSLENVVLLTLNERLAKDEQKSNWSGELSESQLQYAALDAQVVLAVREKQIPRLIEDEMVGVAKIEFECIWAVAQMELNGFYLDGDEWRQVTDKVVEDRSRIRSELVAMLSDTVAQQGLFEGAPILDVDSPLQLHHALVAKGINLPRTDKGNLSTLNHKMVPLSWQHEEIAKLLEYRGVKKVVESYGYNFTRWINANTGRVHPNYRQIGALTGRFACDKPNLQQIPHDANHRGCFKAAPGNVLCIADYSQIELRILAEFSQDPALINAFRSGIDLHLKTAADVFGLDLVAAKEKRDIAKRLNFGTVYGIGPGRFATQTGLSIKEAEDILKLYMQARPQMAAYLNAQAKQARYEKWSRTGAGRLVKYNFDESDKDAASGVERNGKNTPIQGTSADMIKRALRLITADIAAQRKNVKLVHIVHDEIVVECSESDAEWAMWILNNDMVTAGQEFLKTVPVQVDVKQSLIWTKE